MGMNIRKGPRRCEECNGDNGLILTLNRSHAIYACRLCLRDLRKLIDDTLDPRAEAVETPLGEAIDSGGELAE